MSSMHDSTQVSRYVALDVHRNYVVVGAVDSQQHIVLSHYRFDARSFCRLGSYPFERGRRRGPGSELQCLGPL